MKSDVVRILEENDTVDIIELKKVWATIEDGFIMAEYIEFE